MKNTELRIGNLIQLDIPIVYDDNKIISVNVFYINELKNRNYYLYKPIPLTEEWLLKFGFKKCENGWKTLSICNDWTYLSWERLVGIELSVNKHSCMLPNIKYVHQLQNLYFALTGEELTIKE